MDFASYDYNFSDQIQHQDEHHVLENAHQFAWTLNDAPLATEVFLAPQQISAIVQNQQIPQQPQQQQQFMFVQQPVPVPIQQQQQKPFSVPNVVITQHHDHQQQHQIQQQPQQFLQIPQQNHHHQIPQQSNAFSGSLPSSSATDNFFASVMQHQQQQHQIQQMQLQLQQQQQQQFQHQHQQQQQPQFQHLHPLQHPNYELHNHGSSSSLLTIVSNSDSDEPNSSNTAPTSPASIGEFSVNLEPSSANTDQPTAVRVGVKQQRSNSTSSSSAQNRRLRQTRPKVVESKGAIQCKGKNRKKGTQCRNAALMEYIGPRPQYCAEHIELDPFSLYEKCKAGYQKERGDQKSCKEVVLKEFGLCYKHFPDLLNGMIVQGQFDQVTHTATRVGELLAQLEREAAIAKKTDGDLYQRKNKLIPKFQEMKKIVMRALRDIGDVTVLGQFQSGHFAANVNLADLDDALFDPDQELLSDDIYSDPYDVDPSQLQQQQQQEIIPSQQQQFQMTQEIIQVVHALPSQQQQTTTAVPQQQHLLVSEQGVIVQSA